MRIRIRDQRITLLSVDVSEQILSLVGDKKIRTSTEERKEEGSTDLPALEMRVLHVGS